VIRYDLTCTSGHGFDGWFRDSAAFDEQKRRGILACPVCGAAEVDKALMAPAVSKGGPAPEERARAFAEVMGAMRRHVTQNAEYVGDRFPEEARKIHFEEVGPKGIYGEASREEVKALFEEGITVLPVPPAPEDAN